MYCICGCFLADTQSLIEHMESHKASYDYSLDMLEEIGEVYAGD